MSDYGINENWKERIAWCERAGFSRQAIALRCGFKYSTLSDVANGATRKPSGMPAVRLYALSEQHRPAGSARPRLFDVLRKAA